MKVIHRTLWRVIFTTGALRSNTPSERGPWHETKAVAEGWAQFFTELGRAVRLQASNGDIYEGGQLIARGARL